MKKKLFAVTLLSMILTCGLLLTTSEPLRAQMLFGFQGSYGDDTDFGLGARMVFDFTRSFNVPGLELICSFDYFFPDIDVSGVDYTYYEFNGNLAYNVPLQQQAVLPYVGGGFNIAHGSVSADIVGIDVGVSDTEVGLNVLGGMKFLTVSGLQPFLEARFELGGGEQFVLTGGILF